MSALDAAARQDLLNRALQHPLEKVDGLDPDYRGKVRDVFHRGDELFLVATDRVSAFDVVLGTVPLKGALLTEQSTFWLQKTADICPTHLVDRVAPQVMRCKKAEPLPIEMIVRGYLAGSLMRAKPEERGKAYGLSLPTDLKDYQKFDAPLLTPTTKAEVGDHDAPIALADIPSQLGVKPAHLERCVEVSQQLYAAGAKFAEENGLLLVDTKYEFGLVDGEVVVIDEVHTADSSRFWDAASYADRVGAGEAPVMLDKERLRRWLIEQGFQGEGTPPVLTDDVRTDLAAHYWELTERVLGTPFVPDLDAVANVSNTLRDLL